MGIFNMLKEQISHFLLSAAWKCTVSNGISPSDALTQPTNQFRGPEYQSHQQEEGDEVYEIKSGLVCVTI